MESKTDSRETALNILLNVYEKECFLHIEMRRALEHLELDKAKKAFIKRLCFGTVERTMELDAVLNSFSKVKVKKQKPFIRTLLRMSLYQIMYMDSVPDSAAVNEAVKLARKHSFGQLSGFVNGVLRSCARGYQDLSLPENVKYSMPEWLYGLFKEQYPDKYKSICETFLSKSEKGTIIRVNKSMTRDESELVAKIGAKPVCFGMSLYSISGVEGVESVYGFSEGLFSVQDSSAALAVYLSDPKSGEACLDMCAAPGGKTIQLADSVGGGYVESRDISEAKLPLIEKEVERCGFKNVRISCCDASIFNEDDEKKYDIVLADVPCSGLGVIGTKPDIKLRSSKEGIQSLIEPQRRILKCAVRYVKPGGTLTYATCTLNKQENEEQVRWILREYSELELVDVSSRIPKEFEGACKSGDGLTVLPKAGLCEGFFVAVFRMK